MHTEARRPLMARSDPRSRQTDSDSGCQPRFLAIMGYQPGRAFMGQHYSMLFPAEAAESA